MTRHTLFRFALACGILGGVATIRADEPAARDAKDELIAALRAQVRQQAEEIRQLREKARRLEEARGLAVIPPTTRPDLNTLSASGERVPPTWVPREFNGMTYYLVPLTDGGVKVPTTGPARPR